MAVDGGSGTASVELNKSQAAALQGMALRTRSSTDFDPLTGADLGAGPGAGTTRNDGK